MHTCVCLCVFGFIFIIFLLWGSWLHLENKSMLHSVVLSKSRPGKALQPGLPGTYQRLSLICISGKVGQDISTEG